jgi:hypothetical protein
MLGRLSPSGSESATAHFHGVFASLGQGALPSLMCTAIVCAATFALGAKWLPVINTRVGCIIRLPTDRLNHQC